MYYIYYIYHNSKSKLIMHTVCGATDLEYLQSACKTYQMFVNYKKVKLN